MQKIVFQPRKDCLKLYKYDYVKFFSPKNEIEENDKLAYIKMFIETDLWFMVFFVMGVEPAHHPFVIKACHEVENGPPTNTLDLWAREHFKALPLKTPVPTPDGWRNHGDLEPGEYVFGSSGQPVKVLAKTQVFKDDQCFEIEFTDGVKIKSGAQHLWNVEKKSRKRVKDTYKSGVSHGQRVTREEVVMEAQEISKWNHEPDNRLSIRADIAIDLSELDLPVNPYLLGIWLGDGTSASGDITSGDPEVFEEIGKKDFVCRDKTPACTSAHRKINGLFRSLRLIGLLKNKHIPAIYLRASFSQRLSLLQGLMDSDGTVDTRGTATFCNINKILANNVYELVTSLGMKPNIRRHKSLVNEEDYYFFQVSFQAYARNCPFRLQRKINRCKDGERKNNRRFIKSCKPVKKEDTSCIQVDNPNGIYLVGKSMIPTHNSTVITIAETARDILMNPENACGIFSYARPAAVTFLNSIKTMFETNELLHIIYPHVLYKDPKQKAPSWSKYEGLTVKRKSNRREPSLSAWGLTEGMPTGFHFNRMVYDDISTQDIAFSPEVLEKVKLNFDVSQNLGVDGGNKRVVGTIYTHSDPLLYVAEKEFASGEKVFLKRVKAATDDGTANGNPVLLSRQRLEELKTTKTFNCQQLLDPTPIGDRNFDRSMLKEINSEFIPTHRLIKFMTVDPAGTKELQTSKDGDAWAIQVIGVDPDMDDLNASAFYLLDSIIEPMKAPDAVAEIARMYVSWGVIAVLGLEIIKAPLLFNNVTELLKRQFRRNLTLKRKNIAILKPGITKKKLRIIDALEWILVNGKFFVSTDIDKKYRDRIKTELDRFPFWHDDGLDGLAYVRDLMEIFNFKTHLVSKQSLARRKMANQTYRKPTDPVTGW